VVNLDVTNAKAVPDHFRIAMAATFPATSRGDLLLEALQALPGIGPWSAQLIAMRALAWPDAWPASDIGILKALGTRDVQAATDQAETWRPWRAYAVMRLWLSLADELVPAAAPAPSPKSPRRKPSAAAATLDPQ